MIFESKFILYTVDFVEKLGLVEYYHIRSPQKFTAKYKDNLKKK